MKLEKIADQQEKLAQKKVAIEHKEKLLKLKERKLKTRRFIEVGSMASKYGIDQLDDETLIGAFSEMKERSQQPALLAEWKQKGAEFSTQHPSPLIVSFRKEISDELKDSLKERKFKWNHFRKEWQGYGIKEEVENLVKDALGNVTTVNE